METNVDVQEVPAAVQEKAPNWFTMVQLSQRHEGISYHRLRWWVSHRDANGIGPALRKVGNVWFIDETAFLAWLDGHARGDEPASAISKTGGRTEEKKK